MSAVILKFDLSVRNKKEAAEQQLLCEFQELFGEDVTVESALDSIKNAFGDAHLPLDFEQVDTEEQ